MTHSEQPVRERILEAAAALAANGDLPLRVGTLATHAEVSRATLHRHVGSRRAIEAKLRARGELPPGSSPKAAMRERILAGARRALSRYGLLAVTMAQIADEAGVGEATVYRAFGDRDALLRAAFDELPARRAALASFRPSHRPLRALLVELVARLLAFGDQEPEILRLIALASGPEAAALKRLRAGQPSARLALVRWLEGHQRRGALRDGDPERLAGALLAAVHACVAHPATAPGARSVENRAAEVVDLFLDGARARGRRA